MECLQTYGSDDDSSSETEKKSAEDDNKTSSLNSNFFNLEPMSETMITPVCQKQKCELPKEKEDRKKDEQFEIPDSDFWNGFCPSQNDMDMQTVDCPSKSNTMSPYSKNPRATNYIRSTKQFASKRSIDLVKTDELQSEKRLCKGSKNSGSVSTGRPTSSECRKIFFVHNKVMPALSVKSVCKCASRLDSSWPCHDNAINRLSWNIPNYSHLVATAGMDSTIKICNVWSKLDKCVSTITTHSKAVRTILWGNTGRNVISGSYDKTAAVTDIETGSILCRFDHDGFVTACARHPSNAQCFVTGSENIIQMWDQRISGTPVKVFQFKDKLGQLQDLLFIRDDQELISCTDVVARDSADRTIMAWDVRSGIVLSNQIFQERYTCTRLKLHPSNGHFLAQTQGGYGAVFSTIRPYKMDKSKRFEGHQMQGYNIGFDISHDGKFVYSGSAEGGIHCYDYRSGRLLRKCSNLKNSVITDVACHPVLSSVLVACSWGGHLSLWQ